MSRSRLLAAVCAVALAAAPQAAAAKRPARTFAVFPINGIGVPADLAAAVEQALGDALTEQGSVLAGAALAKKVKAPGPTLDRCEAVPLCIAKLGKKAKVSHVVWGSALPDEGGGIKLSLQMIDVATGVAIAGATASIASLTVVDAEVETAAATLMNAGPPAAGGGGLPALEDLSGAPSASAGGGGEIGLELEPLAPAAPEPDPEPAVKNEFANEPDYDPDAEAVGEEDDLSGPERVATAPTAAVSPGPQRDNDALFITGASLTAVAGAALVVGVVFGVLGKLAQDQVEARDDDGVTYLEGQGTAQSLGTEGNAHYDRANIFYIAGGAGAGVGATLLLLDLLLSEDEVVSTEGPAASFEVLPGIGRADLRVRW